MLELDGGVYPFVKTTKENTDDVIDFLNQYAEEHNIVDAKGNKVIIDKNKANTLYMMLFGIGYLTTILQKLIRSAADSNSVQNSSAKQLDLLAETMHTFRKKATYSILDCDIIYTLTQERPSIQLDESTYLSVQQSDGRVLIFVPVVTTVLDDSYEYNQDTGTYKATIQFKCTDAGPIYIPDSIISQFAVVVDGINQISNNNCIMGAKEETTEQLRERLQKRAESSTRMDRCALALTELQGISKASVLFNPSVDETWNIVNNNSINIDGYSDDKGYGPFIIPPRQACLFISGYNDDVPVTFLDHMICLTTNLSNDDNQFVAMNYNTSSGQVIPFYYAKPISKFINVTIYTLNPVTQEVSDNIKEAVSEYISNLNIGQSLSDGEIIKMLYNLYPDLDITGVTFSYNDYYIKSCNTFNDITFNTILTHLNSDSDCVPGYEDSDIAFAGDTVKLLNNMIILVNNDADDEHFVPYILKYNPDSLDNKWSEQKYYTYNPNATHSAVHSVTAYPYELLQTNNDDASSEHIVVVAGRAE